QIALLNLRMSTHCFFKAIEKFFCLAIQRDAYDCHQLFIAIRRTDNRCIALNNSAFLQYLNSPQTGRLRKSYLNSQPTIGHAPVPTQAANNIAVNTVERYHDN